ncbi:condensin-2 complex subunit H2-like [Triticum dicoccoides]|uniref:condensin-2 complex subunit H2-like n=1 Tax=Triticum dicoccoides TaxID=85692 RepID=UPI000E7B2307|nr:condensin-2 complex subunit H2-like [Triticum dicoccoides]
MEEGSGGGEGSTGGGRFPILQAGRDPESNWEVDVAKSLEEYLLKICSGEISGEDFNFAEAALLLQGSVQVYSRKVEYLYSLVLHALEFLSQNKPDRQEKGSAEANENDPSTTPNKEDDMFLGLDDVPAETRTTLDNNLDRDDLRRKIVRPPANLLVFEGDCVDSEASELDSYLLATCGFYGDFVLLDPCDAPAVFAFLQGKKSCKEDILPHRGGSAPSKARHKAFTSPNARSGGTARRKTPGEVLGNAVQPEIEKPQEMNPGKSPAKDWSDHPGDLTPDPSMSQPDYVDPGSPDPGDDSDDEDPYKSLDPHEPGNLKIIPYKRVKCFSRQVIGAPEKKTLAYVFPVARVDNVVSPELTKYFAVHISQQEKLDVSQSVYETLRMSFETGDEKCETVGDPKDDNHPNPSVHYFSDDDEPDIPNDPDVPYPDDEPDIPNEPAVNKSDDEGRVTQRRLVEHKRLADLCQSHLKALLRRIAEAGQQSELDARVSIWRQRIEHALEEQDRSPPFDVGLYGEQILDTLSSRTDTGTASFSQIVSGKPKYEVARTFSALLQLVNGRCVDLDKGQVMNELVCYTAANPFHVKLIDPNRRPEMEACFTRKRVKSPERRSCDEGGEPSQVQLKKNAPKNGKVSSVKVAARLTPEGKRRRRSGPLLQPFSLESS